MKISSLSFTILSFLNKIFYEPALLTLLSCPKYNVPTGQTTLLSLGPVTATNTQGKSSFPINRDKDGVLREEKYALRNQNGVYLFLG